MRHSRSFRALKVISSPNSVSKASASISRLESSTSSSPPSPSSPASQLLALDNKIDRVSIKGSRFYRVDEDLYPSVTSVLGIINKPSLNHWIRRQQLESLRSELAANAELARCEESLSAAVRRASTVTERVRNSAASTGTKAHDLIDSVLLDDIEQRQRKIEDVSSQESASPAVLNAVRAFTSFDEQSGIQMIRQDTIVYSKKHQFAGALDALGRRKSDGALIAIDWKTSNSLMKEYALQVAAYSLAWTEMTGEPVKEALVVRLDKKKPSSFEAKRVIDLAQAQEAFLAALTLWRTMQSSLLKKYKE